MKADLLSYSFVFLLFLALSSCSTEHPKTPEELRAALRSEELLNPLLYLEDSAVTMSPDRRLVREAGLFRDAEYEDDGATIEGTLINKASLAKYKDVVVNVFYYSKTETIIKEEQFVIYEYIKPYSSKKFSLKVYPPVASASFGLSITDAMADFD